MGSCATARAQSPHFGTNLFTHVSFRFPMFIVQEHDPELYDLIQQERMRQVCAIRASEPVNILARARCVHVCTHASLGALCRERNTLVTCAVLSSQPSSHLFASFMLRFLGAYSGGFAPMYIRPCDCARHPRHLLSARADTIIALSPTRCPSDAVSSLLPLRTSLPAPSWSASARHSLTSMLKVRWCKLAHVWM